MIEQTNFLQKSKEAFENVGLSGMRVCFEQASWNSIDGAIKTYYHVHVQHDALPDFNCGVGCSDFNTLLGEIEANLSWQLIDALKEADILWDYLKPKKKKRFKR